MDFHVQQHFHTKDTNLFDEFETEDDDISYDQLRRQVLELTAEDDGENQESYDQIKNRNGTEARLLVGPNNGPGDGVKPTGSWPRKEEEEDYAAAAPAWVLNLWRNGNGTGVFIPQVPHQPRRKSRPRKKKNERGRTYKQAEKI